MIKKAILTGGGRGTRLQPVTATTNKHLLPLANKPMIFHAIEKVVEAGVEEIFINLNPGDTIFSEFVGDGSKWGVKITYFEQTGGPQGIAHVVNEAKQFIGSDPFLFYLSDNILLGSVKEMVDEFERESYDCMLALSKVEDASRFGVPVFDDHGVLTEVVEKPEHPPNNFAVTGVYLYGPDIFFDAFTRIEKSARGEYEISDIHTLFLKDGRKVGCKEITGWWKDTGKPEDMLLANKLLLDQIDHTEAHGGLLNDSVILTGMVQVGAGSTLQNVQVNGPTIIGKNCHVSDCTIGPYVTLGDGTTVNGADIENSIVLEGGHISGDLRIADTLLGRDVRVKSDQGKEKAHRMILGDKTHMIVE